MDTMLLALVALQVIVWIVGLTLLIRALRLVNQAAVSLEHEVRELRVTSRARVGSFKVQSGARSEERSLQRLGRASSGKRIVVGGEDDSPLNQKLTRGSNRGQR